MQNMGQTRRYYLFAPCLRFVINQIVLLLFFFLFFFKCSFQLFFYLCFPQAVTFPTVMAVASRPTADQESLEALLPLDPLATHNEQSHITEEELREAGT
jgi:hypothetical protein